MPAGDPWPYPLIHRCCCCRVPFNPSIRLDIPEMEPMQPIDMLADEAYERGKMGERPAGPRYPSTLGEPPLDALWPGSASINPQ